MADEPTLKDLQDKAKELDISGRSKMDAEELARAIAQAETERADAVAAKAREEEGTYTRDQLAGLAADRVGYPSHVIAGALAMVEGDHDLTIAETKAAVETYLNTPVNPEED